jgi:predicted aspartyl protease
VHLLIINAPPFKPLPSMQDTVGHVEVKIDVKDLEYGRIIRTGALVDTGVTSTTPQRVQ